MARCPLEPVPVTVDAGGKAQDHRSVSRLLSGVRDLGCDTGAGAKPWFDCGGLLAAESQGLEASSERTAGAYWRPSPQAIVVLKPSSLEGSTPSPGSYWYWVLDPRPGAGDPSSKARCRRPVPVPLDKTGDPESL